MYLKRVEFFGFKSFADKTTVEFLPGVTCVVGPNGCGKSNISDAIRWVLGERSAKMLRGSKMEDVIFSGTSFRKPVNMAEVSLTIDNRDKVLSIGYDEVVLTRRLYRSGDSEYSINKTLCRYKDIQDLIMDTGIGSHSYSMIEQGRIDYILQAEPEERRFLIEEAAGISRFKSQKEEAIRKLERTENNMLRLTDIVSEVEKNIKYAERQAKRAERYREYYEELKKKEIQRSLLEIRSLEKRSQEITGEFETLKIQDEEMSKRVETLKQAFSEWERQEEEKLQELRFKESKRFELKTEIQTRESSKAFNFEKTGEIKNQIETFEKELQSLEGIKTQVVQSIADGKNEGELLAAKRLDFENEFNILLNRSEKFEQEIEELEEKEKSHQNRVFENAGKLAACRNAIHTHEVRKGALEISLKKSNESIGVNQKEITSLKEKLSEIEFSFSEKSKALETLENEKRIMTEKLGEIKGEWERAQSFQEDLLKVQRGIDSRIRVFEEIEKHFYQEEGLGPEVISQFENQDALGILFKDLKIQSGFERGVEHALGSFLKTLNIGKRADLETLEMSLVTANFSQLPVFIAGERRSLNAHTINASETGLPLIPFYDVVQAPPAYSDILSYFFSATYFLEDDISHETFLNFQTTYPEVRLIQKSGRVWGPGPLVFLQGTKEFQSFLEKKKECELLLTQKNEKEAELEQHGLVLESLGIQIEDLSREIEQKFDAVRTFQVAVQIETREKQDLLKFIQRKETETDLLGTEARQLEGETVEIGSLLEIQEKELLQLLDAEKSNQIELGRIQEELNLKTDEAEGALSQKTQKELEKTTLIERIKFLNDRIANLEKQLTDEEAKYKRYETQIVEYREKLQEIRFQNERLDEELKNLRETLSQDEISLHHLERERLGLQERKKQIAEELSQTEKQLEEARVHLHRIELESKEIEHLFSRICERIQQAYKVNPREVSLTSEEEVLDTVKLDEDIAGLKEKLSSVGTVNLLAMEEYDELRTRFDFLNSQRNDLIKAKEELLEAIRKINRTTKKLFDETYNQVRTNFQEFFKTLFGGGQADLVMLDEANPLDSGIDIFARPPGKKTQNISLLSGGEKALTAIALLFSLFKIKPAPFSVLDEIDAPLDEANIDRFLMVLKSFLNKTQFIIVTHNRKTIAMGTTLYGITMQEAGVSKVVSVKLQNDENGTQKASVTEQALSAKIEL